MRTSVPNNQMRALTMAMAGAIVASVATMFIPAAVLEGITGSTGLSELVPAASAPLGDTARALIAFAAGAFTLAVLSFILLRQDSPPAKDAADDTIVAPLSVDDEAISLMERLAHIRLPQIALPRIPWVKGDDDITDLSDLPKLRNGDIHPDAPPRRPLSHHDLPVLDLANVTFKLPEIEAPAAKAPAPAEEASEEEAPVEEAPAVEAPANVTPADEVTPDFLASTPADVAVAEPMPVLAASTFASSDAIDEVQPTLAEMVAQLQAAVAERQKQLAELEVVAARLAAERAAEPQMPSETVEIANVEIVPDAEIASEPARNHRPPLEAVPASPAKDEDMDAALAAALATLKRMNGTGR